VPVEILKSVLKKTTETPAGWIGSHRELPEEQAGFKVGWLVIEKTFVDYSKAFDMVYHRMVFETMIEMHA